MVEQPGDKRLPALLQILRKDEMTYEKPYVIAEVGCNHKGEMEIAHELIQTAAIYCKVDAVKFQKRCPRELLTEEQYFLGNIDYLFRARKALDDSSKNALPLLRKDFLFDPLQIEATAATPASAFLLIVRQTPDVQELRSLRELGEKYGLEAVVEVFDLEDLELARKSGAHIIQVNARDLETFAVDRKACLELVREAGQRSGEIWIAASGMECHEHLVAARDAGFHAALVGTALMQDGALEQNLRSLLQSEAATR